MLQNVKLPTPPSRRAYPVAEAAARLGVSRTHLYRLRNEGLIRFTKLLGRTVVTDAEIERILQDEGAA